MFESISPYINILLTILVIILIRANAKLTTEASDARLNATLANEYYSEVERLRDAGL